MQQYASELANPSQQQRNGNQPEQTTADNNLVRRLKPYRLTKSEVLMLSNHRPRSEQVLEVLVEEANIRFSAEQLTEIVGVVGEVFGLVEEEEAEGGMQE